MTTLYLDTEYNGHYGGLISIALYNPTSDTHFYAVCSEWQTYLKENLLTPFVIQHVIPKMLSNGYSRAQIVADLTMYLSQYKDNITVIADWPEDFIHLCGLLFRPSINNLPPSKIVPKLTMRLVTTPDIHKSINPHNALADAVALYKNYKEISSV